MRANQNSKGKPHRTRVHGTGDCRKLMEPGRLVRRSSGNARGIKRPDREGVCGQPDSITSSRLRNSVRIDPKKTRRPCRRSPRASVLCCPGLIRLHERAKTARMEHRLRPSRAEKCGGDDLTAFAMGRAGRRFPAEISSTYQKRLTAEARCRLSRFSAICSG